MYVGLDIKFPLSVRGKYSLADLIAAAERAITRRFGDFEIACDVTDNSVDVRVYGVDKEVHYLTLEKEMSKFNQEYPALSVLYFEDGDGDSVEGEWLPHALPPFVE